MDEKADLTDQQGRHLSRKVPTFFDKMSQYKGVTGRNLNVRAVSSPVNQHAKVGLTQFWCRFGRSKSGFCNEPCPEQIDVGAAIHLSF